jgi:phage replication initiation protein
MGVCLDITGEGLRQIEASGRVKDWQHFLLSLKDAGASFSRLDVACDDKTELLNLAEIVAAAEAGTVCTHFQQWRRDEGKRAFGDQGERSPGLTLYFGSRSSDSFVRIYDKAAQQQQEGHWVRVEMEVKGKRAPLLVDAFIEGGPSALVGYLRGLLDFKEPGEHSERSRWNTVDWWENFLGFAEVVRLSIAEQALTMERVMKWVNGQVAPTLAMVLKVHGGDLDVLLNVITAALPRVKKWRLAQLLALPELEQAPC